MNFLKKMQVFSAVAAVAALLIPMTPVLAAQPATFFAPDSGTDLTTSLNWAGCVATGGGYTSVSATWVVPTVASATSTMSDATWIGIGGVSGSQDLIQVGTQAVTDPSGSIAYSAWYELLPQASQNITAITVHAGDVMHASLAEQATNQWVIALNDGTTGQNFETAVSYVSSLASAEWIQEMPSLSNGFLPLDNFGSVSFSGGAVVKNGATLTVAGAGASPMTMMTSGNQALTTVSALGSDGASFVITRTSVLSTRTTVGRLGRGSRRRIGVGPRGFTRIPRVQARSTRGQQTSRVTTQSKRFWASRTSTRSSVSRFQTLRLRMF